ncbi:hypothetical protein HPP92_016603 [Vanilla planifolia]|uniref:Uncharacterized protein n=1 Tax=Vanilla planifolia TaxID=51239 RepID=A0A835QEE2_VANPL|nr:hypothetical protein HPP92_016603 [Vanilla planifolia]
MRIVCSFFLSHKFQSSSGLAISTSFRSEVLASSASAFEQFSFAFIFKFLIEKWEPFSPCLRLPIFLGCESAICCNHCQKSVVAILKCCEEEFLKSSSYMKKT